MDFDRDYAMLIGGKLDGGSARFDVLNPATEQVIGSVPDATAADLDTLGRRDLHCRARARARTVGCR